MNTNHSHITASEYAMNCQSLALAGQYIMIFHSLAVAGQYMPSCKLECFCRSPQQPEATILHHRDYLLDVANVSDMKYPFPS